MLIDTHIHLTMPEMVSDRASFLHNEKALLTLYSSPQSSMVGFDSLLQLMDEEKISKAIVMGFPWKTEEYAKRHNFWLLNECQKYPNIYPMMAFDPRENWAIKHAEETLAAGAFGIGELAVYDEGFNHKTLEHFKILADLCRKKQAPLLIHVNEPIGHKYPGKQPLELTEIMELIKICYEVKLILAHFGGGLPFFASLKKEIKPYLTNVRFDTAAMPYLYDSIALKMAIMALGAEYFLFGSDFPLLKPSRYLKYFNNILDQEQLELITSSNAINFLGI